MKKLISSILLLGILFLMGCPLKTTYSIDGGSYDIPQWLPGKWKQVKTDDAKPVTYLLKKQEGLGKATAFTLDSLGRTEDDGRQIIFSTVDDKVFICAYDAGDVSDTSGYYIYLFNKISNNEFELLPVKEYSTDADISPADLKSWLLAHKDDASTYDKKEAERYIKQ